MSSNIYEDPDFAMNMRYSKGVRGDDGERVERVVDIYEGAVSLSGANSSTCRRGTRNAHNHRPATKRNPFKAAALTLGVLCLLLLVGISVLFKLYFAAVLKEKQPMDKPEEPIKHSSDDLSSSYCQFGKENKTRAEKAEWQRVQCHCYYMSTEKKNWTESLKDCERRGAKLLMIKDKQKQDLLSELIKRGDNEDSWIGLQTVDRDWTKKWQWVDGSEPTYVSWKVGVNVNPKEDSKAFTDPQGNWNYSTNGSKYWICERTLY